MSSIFRALFYFLDWLSYSAISAAVDVAPPRWVKFFAMYYPDARVRKSYWAKLGVAMGEGTYANPGLKVVNIVGEEPDVVIGRNVSIAPNVVLVTHSSPNNSSFLQGLPYVANQLSRHAKITISDDVWLGASVIVLPGVTIGRGAIVGAGAVVLKDIPAMSVAAGVPARIIRML